MPKGLNMLLFRLGLAVFLIESICGCNSKTYVTCGGEGCQQACSYNSGMLPNEGDFFTILGFFKLILKKFQVLLFMRKFS